MKQGALGKLSEHLQQWRTRWCTVDEDPQRGAPCFRVYMKDGGELRHTIDIQRATLDIGDADTYEFKLSTERGLAFRMQGRRSATHPPASTPRSVHPPRWSRTLPSDKRAIIFKVPCSALAAYEARVPRISFRDARAGADGRGARLVGRCSTDVRDPGPDNKRPCMWQALHKHDEYTLQPFAPASGESPGRIRPLYRLRSAPP